MKEKLKTIYVCAECGETYHKWQGQCSTCKAWNSIEEDVVVQQSVSSKKSMNTFASSAKISFQQLNDIEAWVADATGLAEEEAAAAVEGEVEAEVSVDMDAAIEYFNSVSTAFDAIATEVNNNPDAYTEEFIDQMIGISEGLTECKAGLEAGAELTEEEYADFIEVLGQVEEWLLAVESEVFG